MEHMNVVAKSEGSGSSATLMEPEPMDSHLQAIDAKMQLVLQNASVPSFGPRMTDWDKRQPPNRHNKMLLVSSSHPKECENAHGDHALLMSLKNKVKQIRKDSLVQNLNLDLSR